MTSGTGTPVVALGGTILAGVGGGVLATKLPTTGAHIVIDIAFYAAAVLFSWGVGYTLSKRAN